MIYFYVLFLISIRDFNYAMVIIVTLLIHSIINLLNNFFFMINDSARPNVKSINLLKLTWFFLLSHKSQTTENIHIMVNAIGFVYFFLIHFSFKSMEKKPFNQTTNCSTSILWECIVFRWISNDLRIWGWKQNANKNDKIWHPFHVLNTSAWP